jgi:hypothetical protein
MTRLEVTNVCSLDTAEVVPLSPEEEMNKIFV